MSKPKKNTAKQPRTSPAAGRSSTAVYGVGGTVALLADLKWLHGPWWIVLLGAGLLFARIVFPHESRDKLAWWRELFRLLRLRRHSQPRADPPRGDCPDPDPRPPAASVPARARLRRRSRRRAGRPPTRNTPRR